MISVKKTLYKAIQALPQGGTKNSWVYVKLNGYIVCAQQFTLTPSAANTTTNRTVSLPFTMASTSYYVMVTLSNRVETNVCHVAGFRSTTTQAQMSIFASNATPREVFCLVFGKIA